MPGITEKVGGRIRERRKRRKQSQVELGAKVGLSGAQISRIESGETSVTLDTLDAIADALGCHLSDLWADDDKVRADELDPELRSLLRQLQEKLVGVLLPNKAAA